MTQRSNILGSIGEVLVFVRAGGSGSLTTAAQSLGMSPSGVSKNISRLETRLGVKLFNRTTRSLSLTDEGVAFFEHCQRIVTELEEAESAVTSTKVVPSGRLRVQLPRGLGRRIVLPALPKFLDQFPKLTVDIALDGRVLDLANEGIDVLVQFGPPRDSRLVARRLSRVFYMLCASPGYLNSHGTPDSIPALKNHKCVTYVRPQTGRYREWELLEQGKRLSVEVVGSLNVNDVDALLHAAIAGVGIVYLPDFMTMEAIADGSLKVVMPQSIFEGKPLYVVYPQNRTRIPRVRVFVDFLSRLLPYKPSGSAPASQVDRALAVPHS